MTVTEVAKLLGVSAETIREGLKQEKFPFGTAFKREGSSHYTYVIYPQIFKEYVGDE